MELIVISDTRLKIMLSKDEMTRYSLSINEEDAESSVIRYALREILDAARVQVGFDSSCERVFVQIFESRDGGCEMFVTKYSELYDYEEVDMMQMSGELELQRETTPKKRLVYRFKSLTQLLAGCRALSGRGYARESEAYISMSGEGIYLLLYEYGKKTDVSVVLEYADPVFSPGIAAYISEHCMPLCEPDAVRVLGALA